jgi:hypothetical protein
VGERPGLGAALGLEAAPGDEVEEALAEATEARPIGDVASPDW